MVYLKLKKLCFTWSSGCVWIMSMTVFQSVMKCGCVIFGTDFKFILLSFDNTKFRRFVRLFTSQLISSEPLFWPSTENCDSNDFLEVKRPFGSTTRKFRVRHWELPRFMNSGGARQNFARPLFSHKEIFNKKITYSNKLYTIVIS